MKKIGQMLSKEFGLIQIIKMSRSALDSILDEYRSQRRYREAKRNEYLRRFEALKHSFAHVHHHHPHPQPEQQEQQHYERTQIKHHHHHEHSQPVEHTRPPVQAHQPREQLDRQRWQAEQFELLKVNEHLKQKLVAIESQERDRLQTFKAEIETVRNKYLEEIKKLSESAKHSKEQIQAKTTKIRTQTEAATLKNKQIEETNSSLRKQLVEGNAIMGQYATEIKREYAQKIGEFEKVFNSSSEKIDAMEREFNEDEFVENTLKNEQLLKSIEENAEKAEEAGKLLEDYGALLEGKKEILTEIRSNVEMKEREIEKMVELEGKMKLIMDKLSADKKIYVAENSRMAEELMEIKNLLVGVMNEEKA